MIKDEAYYQHLIKCYIDNNCSPQQVSELFDYLQTDVSNKLLLEQMRASFEHLQKNPVMWSAERNEKMKQDIFSQISQPAKVIPLYRRWLPSIAAAVLIFFVSIAVFKYVNNQTNSLTKTTKDNSSFIKEKSLLPGGNKAMLTLAGGKTIALDDAKNGKLANEGNTEIVKLQSGSLAYQNSSNSNAVASINILSTPRGGQYQVELPDGTKVWLNASTSLKYPTFFSGKERSVELSGEAYFEVAKNKDMPFKVKVNNMEVNVLGTHFNVMAYNDEGITKTTLLEGSVKVNTPSGVAVIVPGEQAKLELNGKLSVIRADIDVTMAWKNGVFKFKSADVQSVARQIARWYDVDIECDKSIEESFTGTISRNVEADKVFKMLQLTGAVKFEVNNKHVFITK